MEGACYVEVFVCGWGGRGGGEERREGRVFGLWEDGVGYSERVRRGEEEERRGGEGEGEEVFDLCLFLLMVFHLVWGGER